MTFVCSADLLPHYFCLTSSFENWSASQGSNLIGQIHNLGLYHISYSRKVGASDGIRTHEMPVWKTGAIDRYATLAKMVG